MVRPIVRDRDGIAQVAVFLDIGRCADANGQVGIGRSDHKGVAVHGTRRSARTGDLPGIVIGERGVTAERPAGPAGEQGGHVRRAATWSV